MKIAKQLFFLTFFASQAFSQTAVNYGSANIQTALNKLNVLASVLYIAAHPDDENQSVLTYMAQHRLYQTAYLAITRGDGGQNLLGAEKGDLLGVIRTQELLAARRIDGAKQYFTRAIDFGYSKSAEETLQKWDRELLLGDMVNIIRQHRPDVIITRFTENIGGHGHHLASAILAHEAFDAAADAKRFPEQLQETDPWQAKRIFWNSFRFQQSSADDSDLVLDVGTYNPLIGASYQEIAAQGRSMHKTQGFGASPYRGESLEYFRLTKGDTASQDIFDGIETGWGRVPGSEKIQKQVEIIIDSYEVSQPQKLIPQLVKLYKILDAHDPGFWIKIKKQEVKDLIMMCSGLWIDAVAIKEDATRGKDVHIRSTVLNRSGAEIRLDKIHVSHAQDSVFNTYLQKGKPQTLLRKVQIPLYVNYTQPYWLKEAHGETMFNLPTNYDGRALNETELTSKFFLNIDGLDLVYETPVNYRWTDPKEGEKNNPFYIIPDVSIAPGQSSYVFTGNMKKDFTVTVKAGKDSVSGLLKTIVPQGWSIEPSQLSFSLRTKNEVVSLTFKLSPTHKAKSDSIALFAEIDSRKFEHEVVSVDYGHIPKQNILIAAKAQLIIFDIVVPRKKIAYIMGSGDEIPQSLQQIGMEVDLLEDEELNSVDYSVYDAVICGVRAFNTRSNLEQQQKRIIDYVQNGGTWIVQHNTGFGTQVKNIGPYPFTQSRQRISQENAPMEILIPDHQIFNYPNKITLKDFDNWVQERSVYMASAWEGKLYPLLAGADSGEPSRLGGLLYASYGKGIFIYSAMSWFRQLPAGVPGAYRIFVNMICAGDKKESI